MDLVVIMNERVRHQSAEMRMAFYRWAAVTVIACVCLIAAIHDAHAGFRAGDAVDPLAARLAGGVSDALGKPFAVIMWIVGNVALVAGMNIAVQGAARQTALRRTAHFWIPSREFAGGLPQPSSTATSYALLAAYLAAAVLTLLSFLLFNTATLSWICQIAQLVAYVARCYSWRQ